MNYGFCTRFQCEQVSSSTSKGTLVCLKLKSICSCLELFWGIQVACSVMQDIAHLKSDDCRSLICFWLLVSKGSWWESLLLGSEFLLLKQSMHYAIDRRGMTFLCELCRFSAWLFAVLCAVAWENWDGSRVTRLCSSCEWAMQWGEEWRYPAPMVKKNGLRYGHQLTLVLDFHTLCGIV